MILRANTLCMIETVWLDTRYACPLCTTVPFGTLRDTFTFPSALEVSWNFLKFSKCSLGIPSQSALRLMIIEHRCRALQYELGRTWTPCDAPSGASPVHLKIVLV